MDRILRLVITKLGEIIIDEKYTWYESNVKYECEEKILENGLHVKKYYTAD